jgi:hypothetical protein
MNWPYQPCPWVQFPLECGYYLMFGQFVHAFMAGVALGLLFLIKRVLKRGPSYKAFIVFNIALLGVAMGFNGVWSCTVWGKYYWSTDYVADFSPFYPISQGVIDARFGNLVGALNGISLEELNRIWAWFAGGTWLMAALLTLFICRSHKAEQAWHWFYYSHSSENKSE